MTEIVHITDHVSEAADNVLSQFDDAAKLHKLIEIIVTEIQRFETVVWEAYWERLLDNAEGAQLETYGKIVGWKRNGATDAEYRKLIRIAAQINQSDALARKAADIVAQLVGVAVRYRAYSPAHYQLYWEVSSDSSTSWLQTIEGIMPRISSKGTSWETVEGSTSGFRLDDSDRGLDQGELSRRTDVL